MTIFQFKQQSIKQLSASFNNSVTHSPALDVEILLSHFLRKTKTQLLMDAKQELEPSDLEKLNAAIEKRLTGLPIAYITGEKEFYGYTFHVTPDVLIPKPDTEILVENAVNEILEKIDAHPNSLLNVCDMCTGSGCIALAVLRVLADDYKISTEELPKFTLVDISDKALNVARKNAEALLSEEEQSRVRFVRSNLFQIVPWKFDLILSNPPYIPHKMVDELLLDGRNEPRLALDGDVTISGDRAAENDGLEIISNLIPQAKDHLAHLGSMFMETGEYNAEATAEIGEGNGFRTEIIKDLEGQLRVVYFY